MTICGWWEFSRTKEVQNYLTCVMYNRRNKFNRLWNALVLDDIKNGKKNGHKYLGMVW